MTNEEYIKHMTPDQKAALNSFISFMANMIIKYYDEIMKTIETDNKQ